VTGRANGGAEQHDGQLQEGHRIDSDEER
jgi:hypothetical protein